MKGLVYIDKTKEEYLKEDALEKHQKEKEKTQRYLPGWDILFAILTAIGVLVACTAVIAIAFQWELFTLEPILVPILLVPIIIGVAAAGLALWFTCLDKVLK